MITPAYAPGENGVQRIAYFGPKLQQEGFSTYAEVLATTTLIQVQRANGIGGHGQLGVEDGANYFVALRDEANQSSVSNPDAHIAQGTVYYATQSK